jgi:hypothetical protein
MTARPSAPIQAWARLLGDGERAEGFEQWMTQTLECAFTPEQIAGMTPDERSAAERRLRMGKIIVAAAIEAIRQEGNGGADSVAVALECAAWIGHALFGIAANTFEAEHVVKCTRVLVEHGGSLPAARLASRATAPDRRSPPDAQRPPHPLLRPHGPRSTGGDKNADAEAR